MPNKITMPCQLCDDDDWPDPTVLDINGILSSLSGEPGCWAHAYEDDWWPCQRKACEEHAEVERLRRALQYIVAVQVDPKGKRGKPLFQALMSCKQAASEALAQEGE